MSDVPGIFVTLGPCDDMRAEVFLRMAAPPGAGAARLEGTLVGPACRRATTLPVTTRLVDLGPPPGGGVDATPTLVARAVLTEPAFWSPELPNLYQLEARIVCGDAVAATVATRVGLRRLGARGRSFRLDGRRWVPRGVRLDAAGFDPDRLRDAAVTAILEEPDESLCGRADADGVAVLAVLAGSAAGQPPTDVVTERIAGWAIHPAVVMALLAPGTPAAQAEAMAAAVRTCKGTLQLGWWVDGAQPVPPIPAGIDWLAVAVGREGTPDASWRQSAPSLPLVACGGAGGRAGCDALQARLAAWMLAGGEQPAWDWAGYVVW